MKVKGLTLDPLTNMPIVILKDLGGQKALPIWVGIFEANAIAMKMENVPTPRPMTHDLIKNIIEGAKARVERVIVSDLKNNTFYASIELVMNGASLSIDSRPSDAIALALRMEAPIFVAEKVIEEARSIEIPEQQQSEETPEEPENLKSWLENLRPEDFGSL
ncbi:MAG: bifunctional nuclease family protein [Candidatus Tectomicrobia bacterium]|nr:bifunctional nuclease family protein [Candidatus Tectomicrobia bacterium]